MWQRGHDAYLEERILSADPLELVRVLYQEAMRAVRKARGHLAAGEITARARAITHAYRVLSELNRSLDHQRGGDLSQRLTHIYAYMMRRLIDANLQQSDGPLAEVLGLLVTLAEAWEGLKTKAEPEVPKTTPWAHKAPAEGFSCNSHAWSF
jgi:flagellar protein FliS